MSYACDESESNKSSLPKGRPPKQSPSCCAGVDGSCFPPPVPLAAFVLQRISPGSRQVLEHSEVAVGSGE